MLLALLAVALLEASNAATGVKNLLLASVERVALRAHVNEHVIFLASGAGHEGVAARARQLNRKTNRIDTMQKYTSPMDSGDPGRHAPMAGREPEPKGLYAPIWT